MHLDGLAVWANVGGRPVGHALYMHRVSFQCHIACVPVGNAVHLKCHTNRQRHLDTDPTETHLNVMRLQNDKRLDLLIIQRKDIWADQQLAGYLRASQVTGHLITPLDATLEACCKQSLFNVLNTSCSYLSFI